MRMASMRESRDSDRFLVNTQVQSHALLRRGFGTSVPSITSVLDYLHLACFVYPYFAIKERVLHETKLSGFIYALWP